MKTGLSDHAKLPATESTRGLPMRLLRRLALAMALSGLLLLYRAARERELPLVTAADITPAMQFAPVRVRGIMAEGARISRRDGQVTVVAFSLHQNGNTLDAVAFGETARALASNERLPPPGEMVELTGTVDVSQRYGTQIRIRSPDHVERIQNDAGDIPP